jgi:hypothetical protein
MDVADRHQPHRPGRLRHAPAQDRRGREQGGSEQGREQQQAAHAAHHIAVPACAGVTNARDSIV